MTRTYYFYLYESGVGSESTAIEKSELEFTKAIPPEESASASIVNTPADSEVEVFFEEYKGKDIVKICEEAFDQLKKVVEEARSRERTSSSELGIKAVFQNSGEEPCYAPRNIKSLHFDRKL